MLTTQHVNINNTSCPFLANANEFIISLILPSQVSFDWREYLQLLEQPLEIDG